MFFKKFFLVDYVPYFMFLWILGFISVRSDFYFFGRTALQMWYSPTRKHRVPGFSLFVILASTDDPYLDPLVH